ncbi:PPPDE putative peptidase domain-containing protein [Spinellus fusiger]|nr:PPPDE putative peptidase domain-containing protein [Spinellus fusiger]
MGETVKLYLYDLSNGMARQMSLALTGKQIDGIWHTSVVLYGQEIYYGQGISYAVPGTTQHGQPLQIFDMGETHLPVEVAEKYHLLDFNCNTFSNDLCQFLTGKTIPKHITDLPNEIMNTPFGQSFLPMIESMFGISRTAPAPSTTLSGPTPSADSLALLQGVASAAFSAAASRPTPVQVANNLAELDKWIHAYDAVVVFFTSDTCPPCRVIKPDFEHLMEEKNPAGHLLRVVGVVVDTSKAMDVSAVYGIRSTPTFIFFHKAQKYSEFKGADYAELKSSVDLLLFTAYPPHPHRKIQLTAALDIPRNPILYTQTNNASLVIKKLDSVLAEATNIILKEEQKKGLEQAKLYLEKPDQTTVDIAQWCSTLDVLLEGLPVDQLFPILDILRCLITTQPMVDHYETDCSQLIRIFTIGYQHENLNKATLLMILRLACNLFSNHNFVTTYFTSHLPSSHRSSLTQLLVAALLSQDTQVRQTAASLAFNCSTVVAKERLHKESRDLPTGTAEQEDDEWQVEIVSALVDSLAKETDEEIEALENKKSIASAKVIGLARDIDRLIQQSLQASTFE